MYRLLPILLRERYRRYKKFIMQKPFLAISLAGSAFYLLVSLSAEPIRVSAVWDNPMILFAVMVYLIAKIINPTQGMTLDYQLLEMKLISLTQYKLLLAVKLLGGSIILSLLSLNSYSKMTAIVSALNILVNVWIFLRNRWDNRIFDFLISVIVVVCIKYQVLSVAILTMSVILGIYIGVKKVHYHSILSLYKLMYKISQQRYHGVVYSETESRDIETSAETLLVGKAKEKNSKWCERFFDKNRSFMTCKETVRLMANFNKIITYFIISMVIGASRFYIPEEYIMIAFLLLAATAMSFDTVMNRSEANLLLRGFIQRYVVSDIIKNKLFVYTTVNFIFLFPSVMLGWKWLILGFVSSFFIALISLYQCFRVKVK